VCETAFRLRELLKAEGHDSWPKLTGGKGVHVMVPDRARMSIPSLVRCLESLALVQTRDAAASLATGDGDLDEPSFGSCDDFLNEEGAILAQFPRLPGNRFVIAASDHTEFVA
jgi:hypothetical protein